MVPGQNDKTYWTKYAIRSLGSGQDTKTDKSIGKIPHGLWPLVNCPTQPTCIAHCDLCICQLYFITNPQWEIWKNTAGQLANSQPNLFKGIGQGQGTSSNNQVENKDRGCARRKAGTRRGGHLLLFFLINHITLTVVTLHRHEINTV